MSCNYATQEVREGRSKVDNLSRQWYKEVRAATSESEDDDGEHTLFQMKETCSVSQTISDNSK